MTVATERTQDVVTRPVDQRLAQSLLSSVDGHVEHLAITEETSASIPIPEELTRIIATVLNVVAKGGTVTIGSLPEELTTTVAAKELGVSRPTLVKMIERGDLPAHKVKSHSRLKTSDVRAFQKERIRQQRAAFDALRKLDDELESL